MSLTLDDIKKKKTVYEKTILELTKIFESDTGMSIENISFIQGDNNIKKETIVTCTME